MPIENVFDKEMGIITRKATGDFSLDDVRSAFEASLRHPDFQKEMPVIWDLRKADAAQLGHDAVKGLADYFFRQAGRRAGFRAALVVSNDVVYGLSRMFEGYATNIPGKINIFKNMDDALHWVKGQDEDQR